MSMVPGSQWKVAPGGSVKAATQEEEPGETYHGMSGKESHNMILDPNEISGQTLTR